MIKLMLFLVVLGAFLNIQCVKIEQCDGENHEDLDDRVTLDPPCGRDRCKLKRGTTVTLKMKFTPSKAVTQLTNEVQAEVKGATVPFIGVDGTTACDHIFRAGYGHLIPVDCPLDPGVEYLYSRDIQVKAMYPCVELRLQWALNDGDENLICYQVECAIVK